MTSLLAWESLNKSIVIENLCCLSNRQPRNTVMDLQPYLVEKFRAWHPPALHVVARTKGSITLDWKQEEPFGFLGDELLYRVEKNHKLPKWIVVYSGGKSTKLIDNLAPRHPHKFRLKIILKATVVPQLAKKALEYYGNENTIFEIMGKINEELDNFNLQKHDLLNDIQNGEDNKESGDNITEADDFNGDTRTENNGKVYIKNVFDAVKLVGGLKIKVDGDGDRINRVCDKPRWVESQWSEETWSSTDTDGTSPMCFCMAVKCGYLKEVQTMLDERPDLVGVANPTNGLTPLATAVRKGDINTVRFLLSLGAEVDQPSLAGQTALHLAVLDGTIAIVELLMEKGADVQARDWNGLRMEHFAVDSCSLEMLKYILDKGGDIHAKDYNGWTPLFRALCQGAKSVIVEELVKRGSDVDAVDNAGLPLTSVAKLLKNRHGRSRDSIMRLIDAHYPHEKALANFTRLTKKIYNVHTLFNIN